MHAALCCVVMDDFDFIDSTINSSAEEMRSIRLRNNNVRQLIYKEVKKPGRAHKELWEMISRLHGPPWVRRQFIMEVKQEAVR